jgi:hypothetical protein
MTDLNKNQLAYIRRVMERTGLAPTALAQAAGVASTTITRPLNDPDYAFEISNRTIKKIEAATGISYADHSSPSAPKELTRRTGGTAPVVATVEAGAWREVNELDQEDMEWVTVPADDKYPDATQRVFDVSGDSMNRLDPYPITNGSRIVAIDYDEIASRVPLRDGLVVVVQRSRNGGQERELTVKQVAWFDDRIEFQPRSTNPKHKPIVVEHDNWEDNGVEVAIVGLVRDIIHRLPG